MNRPASAIEAANLQYFMDYGSVIDSLVMSASGEAYAESVIKTIWPWRSLPHHEATDGDIPIIAIKYGEGYIFFDPKVDYIRQFSLC